MVGKTVHTYAQIKAVAPTILSVVFFIATQSKNKQKDVSETEWESEFPILSCKLKRFAKSKMMPLCSYYLFWKVISS